MKHGAGISVTRKTPRVIIDLRETFTRPFVFRESMSETRDNFGIWREIVVGSSNIEATGYFELRLLVKARRERLENVISVVDRKPNDEYTAFSGRKELLHHNRGVAHRGFCIRTARYEFELGGWTLNSSALVCKNPQESRRLVGREVGPCQRFKAIEYASPCKNGALKSHLGIWSFDLMLCKHGREMRQVVAT